MAGRDMNRMNGTLPYVFPSYTDELHNPKLMETPFVRLINAIISVILCQEVNASHSILFSFSMDWYDSSGLDQWIATPRLPLDTKEKKLDELN